MKLSPEYVTTHISHTPLAEYGITVSLQLVILQRLNQTVFFFSMPGPNRNSGEFKALPPKPAVTKQPSQDSIKPPAKEPASNGPRHLAGARAVSRSLLSDVLTNHIFIQQDIQSLGIRPFRRQVLVIMVI